MTVYGEQLGDDVMGMQGRRASLAGVLAGGVGFVSCATVRIPADLAPFLHFSQQGWLVQPSPTTLSPFGPTSYSLKNDCVW